MLLLGEGSIHNILNTTEILFVLYPDNIVWSHPSIIYEFSDSKSLEDFFSLNS